jgi:enamine deaminase RidA (YjgF/YER057c/UK114 family)
MASDVKATAKDLGHRINISTGSKWEPIMGYSRAVRVGNMVAVTGTVGINADGTFSPDIGEQTRRSLEIITAALKAADVQLKNVIRTRIFTTQIEKWEQIAKVHGQVFAGIQPATTLVGVAKLIDDAALIEIEADALLPGNVMQDVD